MKRILLTFVALILSASLLRADPDAEQRARAALALAQLGIKNTTCSCGENCTCTAGECGSDGCPALTTSTYAQPGPGEWVVWNIQYERAVKSNKPLLTWVGETCPACQEQWGEFVHAYLSEFDSPAGNYQGPGVVLCKPDGLGGMDRVGTLGGIPTRQSVDALAGLTVNTVSWNQQPVRYVQTPTFVPAPMFQPMPMMSYFGGGGGACMGGCCAGGCCR